MNSSVRWLLLPAIITSLALSSCSSQPVKTVVASPSVVAESPSPQTDTFEAGLDKASSASYTAKTAETAEDWDLAVARWQDAIALMQGVPKESANYSTAQERLTEYQRNFVAAQSHTTPKEVASEPVVQKTEQAASTAGIGISRADIQQLYESPSLGFEFEESTPVHGQARSMGKAPNGLTYVEMIGPSSDLTSVALMVGVPKDAPESVNKLNAVLMLGLLKQTCPSWSSSSDWLKESISEATSSQSQRVETTQGSKRISVQTVKAMGLIVLTVKTAT